MKEAIERGIRFASAIIGLTGLTVLGCDYDSKKNIHLYCNAELDGYSQKDLICEKALPLSSLTPKQYKALHRYLIVGPSVRETQLPESHSIYTKDLETDLFGVSELADYVFLPTESITREILGDGEIYSRIIQYLRTYPSDSILVHETGHKKARDMAKKLSKRFGSTTVFSKAVQEEMIAKYVEMLYLQDNYPQMYEKRKQEFVDEIEKEQHIKQSSSAYPKVICNPHGPDPHPPASKLYFAVTNNFELMEFVGSLFDRPDFVLD